jgi:molybdopterin molybdotransferase
MLLSVEAALERILAQAHVLPAEDVPLVLAQGRVLAADLVAPLALPPFANSSMDGYAVRSADLAGASESAPVALRLIGTVPAGGVFAGEVAPGTTVRIFTGAPVPAEADAVLQQELTAPGPDAETILMQSVVTPGQNVREAGSDVAQGERLLARGTTLGPAEIAIAAAMGAATLAVTRRPRVAIVATGDELIPPGEPLGPGQIYNSNAFMLAAAVREAGGEPVLLPRAHDRAEEIRAAFTAAQDADLILSSGGVSVGDFDLVRQVIETLGQIDFWRVNVRPGKPLAFGMLGKTPLLGLPGNPASSAVTFEIFARPLIRALLGCGAVTRPQSAVKLGSDIPRGDRRHYVRARLRYEDGEVIAIPTGDQGSHRIASLVGADALVIITEGEGLVSAGEIVPALLLR